MDSKQVVADMQTTPQRESKIWAYLSMVWFEPILFAFVIFVLFERIKDFMDYSLLHPEDNFLKLLDTDIKMHQEFYVVFLVVLFIWGIGKSIQYRDQLNEKKALRAEREALRHTLNAILYYLKSRAETLESRVNEIETKTSNDT